jgi:hypothetical protein
VGRRRSRWGSSVKKFEIRNSKSEKSSNDEIRNDGFQKAITHLPFKLSANRWVRLANFFSECSWLTPVDSNLNYLSWMRKKPRRCILMQMHPDADLRGQGVQDQAGQATKVWITSRLPYSVEKERAIQPPLIGEVFGVMTVTARNATTQNCIFERRSGERNFYFPFRRDAERTLWRAALMAAAN